MRLFNLYIVHACMEIQVELMNKNGIWRLPPHSYLITCSPKGLNVIQGINILIVAKNTSINVSIQVINLSIQVANTFS